MRKITHYFGEALICILLFAGSYLVGEKTVCYFNKSDTDEWIDMLPDKYVSCEDCMDTPKFMEAKVPDSTALAEAMAYYKIQYPEIVSAQAKLETGNFKSPICLNYHNLFGLWNNRKKDYYKFTYWWESVLAYKLFIQSRYEPPENYFDFLKEIGYAEDTSYISKLKRIIKQNTLK